MKSRHGDGSLVPSCLYLTVYGRGIQPKQRKTGLSRAEIVEAALRIVTEEGLSALSMRRLASEVRVAPMSLYEHVEDKDHLLYEIVDHVLGQIEFTDEMDDPIEAVRQLAHEFRHLLLRYRVLLPLLSAPEAGGTSPRGTAALRNAIEYARRAGLTPHQASVAYTSVVAFVVGHVITHTGALRPTTTDSAQRQQSRLESPDAHRSDTPKEWPDPDESFELGIEALIAGLDPNLSPSR